MEKCGKPRSIECNQCSSLFSSKGALFTHITDRHWDDIKYKCPIYDEKSFNSQGGYYKHLHVKHNLSRKGLKLSDFTRGTSSKTKNIKNKDGDEEINEIQTDPEERNDIDGNMDVNGGNAKLDETPKSGNLKRRHDDSDGKGAPPKKNTRSSGPMPWDCPLCEKKKYTVESNYYKHLLDKCNIDPQGNHVVRKRER